MYVTCPASTPADALPSQLTFHVFPPSLPAERTQVPVLYEDDGLTGDHNTATHRHHHTNTSQPKQSLFLFFSLSLFQNFIALLTPLSASPSPIGNATATETTASHCTLPKAPPPPPLVGCASSAMGCPHSPLVACCSMDSPYPSTRACEVTMRPTSKSHASATMQARSLWWFTALRCLTPPFHVSIALPRIYVLYPHSLYLSSIDSAV